MSIGKIYNLIKGNATIMTQIKSVRTMELPKRKSFPFLNIEPITRVPKRHKRGIYRNDHTVIVEVWGKTFLQIENISRLIEQELDSHEGVYYQSTTPINDQEGNTFKNEVEFLIKD